MSRQIDFTQPLSEDDEKWAGQFHGLHKGLIEMNREQFPRPEAETLEGSDTEDVPYSEWTHKELQAETKRRNTEEGTTLKTTGNVAELAAQLEEDDTRRV